MLDKDFFHRDVLEVAPELVGKIIVRRLEDGSEIRLRITETEAYRGTEDTACHASKGRTPRTEPLYGESGRIYVYLCYGMYWLFNIVTGEEGDPQAVLIRSCEVYNGPGKLTKALLIDKSFLGSDVTDCSRLWLEDDGYRADILLKERVGIGYATEEYRSILWRFVDKASFIPPKPKKSK